MGNLPITLLLILKRCSNEIYHSLRRSNVFRDAKFWFLPKPTQILPNLPKFYPNLLGDAAAHSRRRAKQFGGHEESARMYKTKYFQCKCVLLKKFFTKIFSFFLIGLKWSLKKEKSSSLKFPPFFLIGLVWSQRKGLRFQVCSNIFKFARIRFKFAE